MQPIVDFSNLLEYRYEIESTQSKYVSVWQDPTGAQGFGVGATVWDCSLVLCKYFEKQLQNRTEKLKVLDLSAGTGLTGIVLHKLGNVDVIWTEDNRNSKILDLLKENVEKSLIGGSSSCFPLRWGVREELDLVLSNCGEGFDLIIASDVICWIEFSRDLVNTFEWILKDFLRKGELSSKIVLSNEERNPSVTNSFFDALNAKNIFQCIKIPAECLDPQYSAPEITLFEITLQKQILVPAEPTCARTLNSEPWVAISYYAE